MGVTPLYCFRTINIPTGYICDECELVWKSNDDPGPCRRLVDMGINEMIERQVESVARLAHEVNRGYCEAIGDFSQPSWENAPDWQKESAVKGVMYHWKNPGSTPAQSHESWLEEKRRDGWRYGEVKDPVAKTHPCFVQYDDLPVEQRAKDYLFGAICDAYRP